MVCNIFNLTLKKMALDSIHPVEFDPEFPAKISDISKRASQLPPGFNMEPRSPTRLDIKNDRGQVVGRVGDIGKLNVLGVELYTGLTADTCRAIMHVIHPDLPTPMPRPEQS